MFDFSASNDTLTTGRHNVLTVVSARWMLVGFVILCCVTDGQAANAETSEFDRSVRPIVTRFCYECHSGDETHGDVDFAAIESADDIDEAFELWESVVEHLRSQTMPPEDAPQPSAVDRERIEAWYQSFVDNTQAKPAAFRPRRLSVVEYRNTLRSVLGFDLEVDVIEAEQTLSERSMVIKLLPEDPPGKSGFKNDTHSNPLTTVVWDQYSYLVDAALEELFSDQRRQELTQLVGRIDGDHLLPEQAETLIRKIAIRANRRDVSIDSVNLIMARLQGLTSAELASALKVELETLLMSPSFLYRGLRLPRNQTGRQKVDAFELAERLSYFIWADMPDSELMQQARTGDLADPEAYAATINRMLESKKSASLADVFATEWLSLSEIQHVVDNPPAMLALKTQPLDFFRYLIDEDRPLIELIDSKTAFANRYTAGMYGKDAKQLAKTDRQRGIEQRAIPNQRIHLEHATHRGGILTMPGVLAMNRGPILRGTWVLERILGEELPDPPANVGQVPPNRGGATLTFRQRFEAHRANASCAVCHDKIDPLGFALQAFADDGQYVLKVGYKPGKKRKQIDTASDGPASIDTSGKLPSGETFDGIAELKQILSGSQREQVIRNIVQRMMAYALCRKLTVHDSPVVREITQTMMETNGSWRDLIHAIAGSMPFRETIILESGN